MTNNAALLARDVHDWSLVQVRRCGECSLCCRVLPVRDPELDKNHGVRCKHQRHTGCAIYETRPCMCRGWNCGWLQGFGVDGMSRPDRAGYVIDPIADFITVTNSDGSHDLPTVVVWVDPKTPEKWRHDEHLKAFFERWGRQGFAGIVRYTNTLSVIVFPASLTGEGCIIKDPQEATLTEIDPVVKFAKAAAALQNMRSEE